MGDRNYGNSPNIRVLFYACRRLLARWGFWVAICICFGTHLIAIWVVFHVLASGVERFSILLWFPIMLVEVFFFLIVVKRIHDRLSGNREKIELRM